MDVLAVALIAGLSTAVIVLAVDNARAHRHLRDLTRAARSPRHVPRHADAPTAVLPRQGGLR